MMIKALIDASLLSYHTEDIWSIVHVFSASSNAPKHDSLWCLSSCPCGIEASLKGSVSLWWLGFGCKVPAVICATCRRKNPKPCVYVCSKTQLNLEARKQNVTGSLYVAAALSAMWCGRPPSPARHKQAPLQFCWNVANPSAKWNPSLAVLLAETRQFLLTGFVANTSAGQKQNKFSVILCTETVFC